MAILSSWTRSIRNFFDNPEFRNNTRIRLGVYVALCLLTYLVLIGSVLPPRYDFVVGQTSPVTIRAPITAVDTLATQRARQEAMDRVPKQYEQSTAVEEKAIASLKKLFATATQVVSDKSLTQAERLEALSAVAPENVSQSTLQAMLGLDVRQLGLLQSVSLKITHDLLDAPFYEDSAQQAGLLVDRQLLGYDLDKVSRFIVQNVVESVLKPNMVYNPEATQKAREAAASAVPEVYIHEGEVIVSKNGIITPVVQSRLRDVGLYSSSPSYGIYFGFALFVVLSIGLMAAYIERRSPRRKIDNLYLIIFSLIILLMSILIAVTKGIINSGGPTSAAYLVPISVGAMLITVLMDSSLAVVTSFYLSLLFGATLNYDYWIAFYAFISSMVGAYSVAKVTHRGTFMRAGFLVSAINVLTIVTMHLLKTDHQADLHTLSLYVGLGVLNGLVSAVLTMGILPFFETAFGLLTSIRLLELSNPNNPLLKKVLMEAPGTYHHSLIVGNLAEAAAEIVGADPLICRVGAYYHDVGKTKRPLFFVENQMTKDNPHDKIAPSLSHLIITSHVTDGLEMLEKAGLPKPIRDICATHHGTTILWYFYNKAKEADKNGTVKIDDFRYPGPKPKTRESAIVMICDAVEAAVRSMAKPTPNRVEGVIRKIIRDRLQDGQLDECDLTLQDLDVMVGAFMKTLKGIYHSRIEYPDPDKIRKEVAR
jgi:putative nucleotidyltransferase with HDIG domain